MNADGPEIERLRAELAQARSALSLLQRKLHDAHASLSADGGVSERDCECDDCLAYRSEPRRGGVLR